MNNLKTLTLALLLTSVFSTSNTIAMIGGDAEDLDNLPRKIARSPEYKAIKTVGKSFVTFLQKVGQSDTPVTQEEVSQLFAPHSPKIVNCSTLFTLSIELPDQLINAREAIGKWTIETLWSIASTEDRACTIQFKWKGEKMGDHTTMVTLFLNSEGKISQVSEVFNECSAKAIGS